MSACDKRGLCAEGPFDACLACSTDTTTGKEIAFKIIDLEDV